ncbi:MAG: glycoside hydrolase family 15 protein, partial [Aquificota bacterium]
DFDYTVSKRTEDSGSWREIQEGILSKRKIIQGDIDSAIAIFGKVKDKKTLFYYIAAGKNYDEIKKLNTKIREDGIEHLIEETGSFWRAWIVEKDSLHPSISPEIKSMYYRSLLLVRAHIDRNGAIIAANDTTIYKFNKDHYSYMWPRDGAFTAIALDRAGYTNITKNFFRFCAEHITDEGFMLHKYSPDGSAGSSWHPWCDENGNYQLPIQEDETALVIWALYNHYKESKDIEFVDEMYNRLVRPAAEFMVSYRDEETGLPKESYDLWEERRGILTYTCSTVYAGLYAASNLADLTGNHEEAQKYRNAANEVRKAMVKHLYDEETGRFVRMIHKYKDGTWIKDTTVESSLALIPELGVLPENDYRVINTMKAIGKHLWVNTDIGGIARYQGDYYHRVDEKLPGNPWIVTTLWMANWYIDIEEFENAIEILNWVLKRKLQAGLLAEQYNPYTGEPLSVTPLTWSHSSFCYTVQKLNKKLKIK